MTIKQALNLGHKGLRSTSDSPALDAEVLLCFVLKKPKVFIFANQEVKLPEKKLYRYLTLVKQRKAGWPVAYLTGEKEFFGLKFHVTKDVLIPRPETETLVELVLKKITRTSFARPPASLSRKRGERILRILDIGTGTGCIIISLAKALQESNIRSPLSRGWALYASDISKKALSIAQKNARRHKLKITFRRGNLLEPWESQKFDVIIANLPYLTKLKHPSTRFEPKNALISKKQGLDLIEKFFNQIAHLRGVRSFDRTTKQSKSQLVFVEFDPSQANKIIKLAKKFLPEFETKIFKDLYGQPRFALLQS